MTDLFLEDDAEANQLFYGNRDRENTVEVFLHVFVDSLV